LAFPQVLQGQQLFLLSALVIWNHRSNHD
jgi:hypothetical protein